MLARMFAVSPRKLLEPVTRRGHGADLRDQQRLRSLGLRLQRGGQVPQPVHVDCRRLLGCLQQRLTLVLEPLQPALGGLHRGMLIGVAGAQQGQLAEDGDDVLLHPAEHRIGLHQPLLHGADFALGPGQFDLSVGQLFPQRRHPLQVCGPQSRELGSMPRLELGQGLLALL
ncbi:hypothetical protein [Dankookia sp. P2]|uniref:hypothetical protein n=1 Tax=Dankookia sp. P2 TaxID=3423955 RepID=UPI003D679165